MIEHATLLKAVDFYLMSVGFFIGGGLLFSIFSKKQKPHRRTCLVECIVLTGIIGCYIILELRWALVGLTLNTALWYVLLFQKRKKGGKRGI